MAGIQATDIRKGVVIIYEGAPYRVMQFEHRTPGNLRAFVQAKLRHMRDGTQKEVRFSATEFVERAHVDTREMDYLYADSDGAVFMDVENYEQITLSDDDVGDAKPWLAEGMRVQIQMLNETPIGIQLPKTVEITIKECEPVIKGQTAAKSNKPAVLENGVSIAVPQFIKAGDRVRVDPGELRYIERVK
jgi:elongation factor P